METVEQTRTSESSVFRSLKNSSNRKRTDVMIWKNARENMEQALAL